MNNPIEIVGQVLTMNSEERSRMKDEDPGLAAAAGKEWCSGKTCGQCQHFSQLGTREGQISNVGVNGVCRALATNDYLKPGRPKCDSFVKKPD